MTDDRVIYIRWSDDGRFIRKWDTKPFDGAEPMYSRSWLLSEERVLPCDVTVHPATTFKAGVKLSTLLDCIEDRRAAIGDEFSGWVEVVEEGE